MFYPNLKFPKVKNRPFFYTNFVATVDGKVAVGEKGYWPIGSKFDHQVLLELRAYADCLIHGGNLAREFGEVTAKSLNNPKFKAIRKKLGKNPDLPYYIISRKSRYVNSTHARYGLVAHSLDILTHTLQKKGYQHVLVEGGPTLLGSFLKAGLIDEIFLTIAPKIYGTKQGSTLTLIEGYLFPPKATKKLQLLSCKPIEDEIFLRYRVI